MAAAADFESGTAVSRSTRVPDAAESVSSVAVAAVPRTPREAPTLPPSALPPAAAAAMASSGGSDGVVGGGPPVLGGADAALYLSLRDEVARAVRAYGPAYFGMGEGGAAAASAAHRGLLNQGATCYMNSLLQVYIYLCVHSYSSFHSCILLPVAHAARWRG